MNNDAMMTQPDFLQPYFSYFLICAGVSLLLSFALLVVAFNKVRHLDIPKNADLTTTLLAIPLTVVVGIDLLDLALDFLALPIVWIVLDRMKLRALRNVSSIEVLIPFTGPIPTFTLAWIAVRMGVRL